MKDEKKKGYELPKLGLPPIIHGYLYKDADWHRFSIDWEARADLFERQYKELKDMIELPSWDDTLVRHEAERHALKGNP